MIPRLLLTFANPAADDPGHLRGLPAERAAIAAALEDAVGYGLCAVDIDPAATRDGLIERLQDGDAMAHVVVFHYAGHASGSALAMDGAAGQGAAYAAGIAALLGQLPRLELVFLNGCSTQDQVDALLAAGVPAVIATAVDIIDAVATDFATHFYGQLGRGAPVQAAFAAAEAAVRTTHADPTARRNLGRSFLPQAAPMSTRLPWTLHVARDDDAAWSLPDAADDPLFVLPRPAWPTPTRPYPGVTPYTSADGAVFCGRRHEIRALFDALKGPAPLVVLHGPPQVGRTSLLAAGLLPRLQVEASAALVDAAGWQTPGDILLIDDADALSADQIVALAARDQAVVLAVVDPESVRRCVPDAACVALDHLDAAAIEQVIVEPMTALDAPPDPSLVTRLTTDLRGGASTPIAAVVLADLWAHRAAEPLTVERYAALRNDGRLDGYVDAQLNALGSRAWIESGFALDALAAHLTVLGTPRTRPRAALATRYPQRTDLDAFITAALRVALLVRTADGTRLGHPLLAPFVANRFGASRAPAQQARRIIEERLPAWAEGADGPVLDAVDLQTVLAGRDGMPALDADAERLITTSQTAVTQAATRKRITRLSFVAAAVVILALAFIWQQQRGEAEAAQARTKASQARAEAAAATAQAERERARLAVQRATVERERAAAQKARANAEKAKAEAEAAKAEQLTIAQDMAEGLLAAYPKLEDPARQALGIAELLSIVAEHPKIAPATARLAARTWSMVLGGADEAAQWLARPMVSLAEGTPFLMDRRGENHALNGQPDSWFILPGGHFVGVHDPVRERLDVYDAQTGARRESLVIGGTFDVVAAFRDAPHILVVIAHQHASEVLWKIGVVDARAGKGRGAVGHFEDLQWTGTCASDLPVLGQEKRIALGIDVKPDGSAVFATARPGARQAVEVDDCIKSRIDVLPIGEARSIAIAPPYARWTQRPATAAEKARAVEGLRGTQAQIPPALRDQRSETPDDEGCQPGCGFLDGGLAFGVDGGKVVVERAICDTFPGAQWLPRWCHTDGRSGYAFATPAAMRSLTVGNRPAPRRRGDYVLFQGMLLNLATLEPLLLRYAGVAHDFAVSDDEQAIMLLTRDAVLHLLRAPDATEYTIVQRQPLRGKQGLAVTYVGEVGWALQTDQGLEVRQHRHDEVLWRRRLPAKNGGLATNGRMLLARADDRVALWSFWDGVALSPAEKLPLGPTPQMTVTPDGAVRIVDGCVVWERRAPPARPGPNKVFLRPDEIRSKLPDLPVGARCPKGRELVEQACWPLHAAPVCAIDQ